MSALIDLTGQIFGKLVVIKRGKNCADKKTTWVCRCACGREIEKRMEALTRRHLETCGVGLCRKNAETPESLERRKIKVKAKQKHYSLRHHYKMSLKEYEKKLEAQKGNCAICGLHMETPNVDHDHATNKNRDLLCLMCNHLLGNAKDDEIILAKAILYLRRHRG